MENGQLTIFEMKPERPDSLSTNSPINMDKLAGQNAIVYNYLTDHETIDMFIAHRIGVMHLHSRISDLRTKHKVKIYDRIKTVNDVTCKDYSLTEFKENHKNGRN